MPYFMGRGRVGGQVRKGEDVFIVDYGKGEVEDVRE